MVRRRKISRFAATFWCLVVVVASQPALAGFVATVDGDLSEWGITVADNDLSSYAGLANPSSGSTTLSGSKMFYHVEDQDDNAPLTRFLGPNVGGQAYDAEFMGMVLNGSTMSIALVVGQRPDNNLANYSPGDLLIQTSTGVYGIEVGGVPPTPIGSTSAVVNGGDPGVTFNVGSNGHTTGYQASDGTTGGTAPSLGPNVLQVAGSIWQNPKWLNDPILPYEPTQQLSPTTASAFGQASYVYTLNSVTTQHAIMELTFNALGMGTIYSVRWTPGCGNDVLLANFTEGGGNVTPEPSAFAVWGLGALCIFGLRRWRRGR